MSLCTKFPFFTIFVDVDIMVYLYNYILNVYYSDREIW